MSGSMFKEKDDEITRAFHKFYQESDDDDDDDTGEQPELDTTQESIDKLSDDKEDSQSPKKHKTEESSQSKAKPGSSDQNSVELISLDESSDEYILIDCGGDGDNDDTGGVRLTRSRSKKQTNKSIAVVTISSDEDSTEKPTDASQTSIIYMQDASQDLDDYDFSLKLTVAGTYKAFPTTYKTKLNQVLKDMICELESRGKQLIITSQNETISLEESPFTLKLTPGTILTAIEVSSQPDNSSSSPKDNPDIISVKLQDGNRKHTKTFKIKKLEPLLRLKEQYVEMFNLDSTGQVKLLFDGDIVEDDATPEELEIEDDCVLDVVVS